MYKVSLKSLNNNHGGTIDMLIIFTMILIFVLFPLYDGVVEKYLLVNKSLKIRDAVDMANMATYNALNINSLSKTDVNLDNAKVLSLYKTILAEYLKLNPDLTPKENSIAEGTVVINSIQVYIVDLPQSCPNGKQLTRPSVHANITIPLKPSLFRAFILEYLGLTYINVNVHIDTDIPVNN